MNKFLVILSLSLTLLTGCKDEYTLPEGMDVTEYLPEYMFYDIRPPYLNKKLIKIEYNENRTIAKRTGDIISLSGTSGFNGTVSDLVYDQVLTNKDIVTITKQIVPNENNYTVDPMERVIHFKDGRMVMKISDNESTKDTITYSYNERGQIFFIETRNLDRYRKTETKLTYDENRNLTMVSSKSYHTDYPDVISKDTIRFSNYDHARNPLTHLIIFDECFYRSLSSNNFTTYNYKKYDSEGQLVENVNQSWELTYDSDNYPIFSK